LKITLINQYTGPLFIDVVNAFAKHHQVCLLTGSVQEGGKTIDPSVKIKKLATYRRNTTFSRFFTWKLFALQSFLYLLKANTGHLLCVSNPPFAPLVGALLHKIKNKSYSILIYDLYPDVMEHLGYLSANGWVYKLWGRMNLYAFSNASRVFTISHHMALGIKKYLKDSSKEVKVIPPWADNQFIKPIIKKQNPFCLDNKMESKFIILYSGNMGITHDLESMVTAAISFKNELGISFILIGDGAKRQALMELAEVSNLDNVHFLPFQNVAMLPYSLASGDIGVITLGKGAEMMSVPSKTYSMMAAGCALLIIADRESEIARLTLEHDCGGVFAPGDVEGIIGFINLMYANKALLERYKANARRASHFFTHANALQFVENMGDSKGDVR
jgi:glycosyltransferase involved in cell wall biosynthesis